MLLTATSRQRVYQFRHERMKLRHRIDAGPDQRRRCNKSGMEGQGLASCRDFGEAPGLRRALAAAWQPRQHLLDLDGDAVAVDEHHAAGDWQVVGEDLDLVGLGGVQFDDGAAAEPHDLMDGHRGGPEDHHEIDADVIEGWHRKETHTDKCKVAQLEITTLWLANG